MSEIGNSEVIKTGSGISSIGIGKIKPPSAKERVRIEKDRRNRVLIDELTKDELDMINAVNKPSIGDEVRLEGDSDRGIKRQKKREATETKTKPPVYLTAQEEKFDPRDNKIHLDLVPEPKGTFGTTGVKTRTTQQWLRLPGMEDLEPGKEFAYQYDTDLGLRFAVGMLSNITDRSMIIKAGTYKTGLSKVPPGATEISIDYRLQNPDS